MKIGRNKEHAKFTILVRNNKTNKYKCCVFENEIKTEKELLNLIKELLIKHYKEIEHLIKYGRKEKRGLIFNNKKRVRK